MIKKMMFILDSYNFFSLITRLNEFRRVKIGFYVGMYIIRRI